MASIINSLIPRSPIHGIVNTVGDATHGPFIKFLNPSGSNKNVIVWEIRLGATLSAGTSRMRLARVTGGGTSTGGTETIGFLEHRDETDATAISATLKGYTAVAGTPAAETASFWFSRISGDASAPYSEVPVIVPLGFPLVLKPNTALEFFNPDASASNAIRMFVVFDEVAA